MGVIPVPIPNTVVKPHVVDGTMLATAWESRTALHLFKTPKIDFFGVFL